MKKTTIIISAAALSASLFTSSAQSEEKAGEKGNRPDLQKLDKDGDHAISAEEAGPQIWERLGKLDKNGDGKVAGDEFPRPGGGGTPGGPGGKGDPGEFMKRMDKNSDGNIAKDEVPEQLWTRLSELDKDGNNSISKEEFAAAARAKMAGGDDFFGKVDKNKDGKLTQDEIPQMWEKMSKADRDNDGAISKDEMAAVRAYTEKAQGGMSGKGAAPGGPNAIFGKYDEDKDGKLSKEEVPAELWAKLSNADDDADGLVSQEELGNVYRKMQSMNPGADKPDRPKRPAMEKTDA